MTGTFSLVVSALDTVRLLVTLERNGTPILPSNATSLTFTARTGATAIQKTIGSGISIVNDAMGEAEIRIDPDDFVVFGPISVKLSCRLHLVEGDGTETTVARGAIYIESAASAVVV